MRSLVKRLPKRTASSLPMKQVLPMKVEMDTVGFMAFQGMFDRMLSIDLMTRYQKTRRRMLKS